MTFPIFMLRHSEKDRKEKICFHGMRSELSLEPLISLKKSYFTLWICPCSNSKVGREEFTGLFTPCAIHPANIAREKERKTLHVIKRG